MFLEHGRHRARAVGLILAAVALFIGCSGDDGAGPLTAAQAETIAAQALLAADDLPAGDWQRIDEQIGLDSLILGGAGAVDLEILPAECQTLEDAIGNLPALRGDVTPLAASGRSFTSAGQLLDFRAVSTSVVVFEDPAGAERAAALLEDAFSPDSLEDCILPAALPVGDDAGIRIVEFSLATPVYALDDSTALIATIDAIAVIIPINLTVDLHAFQRDNVLALYVGLQLNSNELAEEHAGLLTIFSNRVQDAQTSAR